MGEETSARNSGVIHSGIYYPANSLKARLCVAGGDRFTSTATGRGIDSSPHRQGHRRSGSASRRHCKRCEAKGLANGVTDLEWLSGDEVARLEPQVRCAAGLWSPSTGIVDVHAFITFAGGGRRGGRRQYRPGLRTAAGTRR